MMTRLITFFLSGALLLSVANANEINFIEEFALAQDRSEVIERLIPGTDQYYFYTCLHQQHQKNYAAVEPILKEWSKRHGSTGNWQQIARRQALLTYPTNPKKALAYLEKNLGLNFNHRREILNEKPKRATKLDTKLISAARLRSAALKNARDLSRFTNAGLRQLDATKLPPHLRRDYLTRLRLSDYPNLPELIVKDLKHDGSRGFGSLTIHRKLTLAQLEGIGKLYPTLLGNDNFINETLKRLQPSSDTNWRHDSEATRAYLDRLWAFVEPLNPSQNSLKAHVLYQRMLFDSSQGTYSRQQFIKYLQLPRPVRYVNPKFMRNFRGVAVDLSYDCTSTTLFPPIHDDESLVRKYLLHFLTTDASTKQFAEYIEENYLKRVFAEAKLLAGEGNAEKWYSMLPPTTLRTLRDRVDIEFSPENSKIFGADDDVRLKVDIKNAETIIVKVFEINTPSYYRHHQREVNTDIDLDGLVPNHEKTYTYGDPPLRRVTREFEFPQCNKPGVYVIDFIGNGVSSRAVIRKGKSRVITSSTTTGQVFTILDEDNQHIKDVKVWLEGREFESNEHGYILIPYSTQPRTHNLIVEHDGVASLHTVAHSAEKYQLFATLFVDKESLRKHSLAKLVVRAGVTINGKNISIKKLQNVTLRIAGTDLNGVKTEMDVQNFELFDEKDSIHEFHVLDRLASLAISLHGTITNRSDDEENELSVTQKLQLNQVDRTQYYEGLHLVKVEDAYHIELRGKSGEILPDRVVHFGFSHRDFTGHTNITLQTDANGRIELGSLKDITTCNARMPSGLEREWTLDRDDHSQYQRLHSLVGEPILIPYTGTAQTVSPDVVALHEVQRGTTIADRLGSVRIDEGFLTIEGLEAGDYQLWLKESGKQINLQVTQGEAKLGFAMGSRRLLELRGQKQLHITDVSTGDDTITIQLANPNEYSRVHVFANRFEHGVDHYASFFNIGDSQPISSSWGPYTSLFASGRDIGDELRYIIDRQYADKFPGNMLKRPGLLLNPWETQETQTSLADLRDGEEFAPQPDEAAEGEERQSEARGRAGRAGKRYAQPPQPKYPASIDFLAEGTAVLLNLKPNADGVITIKRDAIGAHQRLHIVAVDPATTAYKELALSEVELPIRDLRLLDNLAPEKHYTRQKQITVLNKDDSFVIDDVTSARFDQYDNLSSVYNLLVTLGQNEHLKQFEFIRIWPTLTDDEKREKYSEFACHELHFFLYHKDVDFFNEVVRPFLANKMHKTFMDRWLLDDNLESFRYPWQFNQLNVLERVLLGQKLDGQLEPVKRHVHDLYTLKPINNATLAFGFESAVAGRRLNADNENALRDSFAALPGNQPRRAAPAKSMQLGANDKSLERLSRRKSLDQIQSLAESAPFDDRESDSLEMGLFKEEEFGYEGGGGAGGGGFGGGGFGGGMFADDDVFGDPGSDLSKFYRKLGPTKEWAENNYYRLPIAAQNASLIEVDSFWHDYANHAVDQPFYSEKFTEAAGNFSESMLALAVLDLPFESTKHDRKYEEAKLTIKTTGPVIMFHEQVREVESKQEDSTILISQNFFRHGDRHEVVDGQQRDKFITDEFVVHTVYGCQIVVTNTSSSPQNVDVLLQIPAGSLPMVGAKYTETVSLQLPAYSTKSHEYHFYFPTSGQQAHFPVHVSKEEQIVASAKPFNFNVVDEPTELDTESWAYVSQNGSEDEVMTYLKSHNLQLIDLSRIAFRMSDKAFFKTATSYLDEQHAYNPVLWSYGVKHDSPLHIRQFLLNRPDFINQLGSSIDCDLVAFDPVERRSYQHFDYRPIVNARAHQLGRRRTILNSRLHAQYHELLRVLAYKATLDKEDNLAVAYYLVLQDRIAEALDFFTKVDRDSLPTKIQYDYLAAYLDCFQQQPETARQLAAAYSEHPVPRWRKAFGGIQTMLDELDGKAPTPFDEKDRTEAQTELAANAPSLEFEVESGKINLTYANIKNVDISYYLMDLELLFSRNPFVQQFTGQFSSIRPNEVQSVELPVDRKVQAIDLPKNMQNRNVLIEILGEGKSESQAYYSNNLTIELSEDYGQVRVTQKESTKPLPTTYVKVYAQMNHGGVQFYKDGYTDLRGRFDYASLNTSELDNVVKFSLLILSDEHGAVVREARPPKR